MPGADLNFGITITVGTPPVCRFGMLYSCILRSHATRAEGTFCSVAGSCDLIFGHPVCATFWCFVAVREGELPCGQGCSWRRRALR